MVVLVVEPVAASVAAFAKCRRKTLWKAIDIANTLSGTADHAGITVLAACRAITAGAECPAADLLAGRAYCAVITHLTAGGAIALLPKGADTGTASSGTNQS